MTLALGTATIRLATLEDVLPCAQLLRKLRLATFWRYVVPDEEPGVLSLLLAHRLLTSTTSCLYVAELDGEIIGLCGGEITRHFLSPSVPILHEWAWWVEEPYRSGTMGGRLWLAIMDWGRARGARVAFRVHVRTMARAGSTLGEEVYTVQEVPS